MARLEEVASQIKAKGGRAEVIQTDISHYEQIKRMVTQTTEEFGKLDILINNAAAYSYNNADVPDMDLDVWFNTMEVNVNGTMLCAKEAMKAMIPRQSGVIVNVSSVAAISGHPTESPDCVLKVGHHRLHRGAGDRGWQAQYPGQYHQPRGYPHQGFRGDDSGPGGKTRYD